DTGAIPLLAVMANHLAALQIHSGAFSTAEALIGEVGAITRATGIPHLGYSAHMLPAFRGDRRRTQAIWDSVQPGVMARGEGAAVAMDERNMALLGNGDGRYGDALAAARRACEYEEVIAYGGALVELVEAGVRGGAADEARTAL